MKAAARWIGLAVLFCGAGIRSAQAQYVIGMSVLSITPTTVETYSDTELDYTASLYYDAITDGYLYRNGMIIASGSAIGCPWADGYMTVLMVPNSVYRIETDHGVRAYYYEYVDSTIIYEDPYGFSWLPVQQGGGNESWDPPGTYTTVLTEDIYLGTTAVESDTYAPIVTGPVVCNPSQGVQGYVVGYGMYLSNYWGPTWATTNRSDVTLTVSYVGFYQVNVLLNPAPNAPLGRGTVWISTIFGTTAGIDYDVLPGADLTLSRVSLTQMAATGSPTPPSTYSWGTVSTNGLNPPLIDFADGYTATTHPNRAEFIVGENTGDPTEGGWAIFRAHYTAASGQTSYDKQFYAADFGLSCYLIATESDFWNGSTCSSYTIYGVTYSGTTSNPPNLVGTYCSAFLADTRLQGSGIARDGTKIQYDTDSQTYHTVTEFTVGDGPDGNAPVANRTVARDRSIIPRGGWQVNIDGYGSYTANDVGKAITGYRIDMFMGVGHAACTGFPNPLKMVTCSPGNQTCPSANVPW